MKSDGEVPRGKLGVGTSCGHRPNKAKGIMRLALIVYEQVRGGRGCQAVGLGGDLVRNTQSSSVPSSRSQLNVWKLGKGTPTPFKSRGNLGNSLSLSFKIFK